MSRSDSYPITESFNLISRSMWKYEERKKVSARWGSESDNGHDFLLCI